MNDAITDQVSRFNDQVNQLIAENRRLRVKSEEDDETIRQITDKYERLSSGVESLIEDHRRTERELAFRADRAEIAERKMESLLGQAADLILQATRAKIGDDTPESMPERIMAQIEDNRLPAAPFN